MSEHVLRRRATSASRRQRLGAENIDIDKNYGLDVLGIPGTNGPDRLQGGYPRFVINGFSSIGNPNVSNPFSFRDNQYVAVGNLSWLRGSHWLRFGGEYTYYTINHFQPQAAFGPRGGFTFTGGLTALRGGAAPTLYNGFADFLLGLPQSMGKDLQFVNPASVRMPSWGFYARDQWQINRKLTLNYGMRYEYYPFATRADRGGERYDPVTDKVFIGGAWRRADRRRRGRRQRAARAAPRRRVSGQRTRPWCAPATASASIRTRSATCATPIPATISSQFSGASTVAGRGIAAHGHSRGAGPRSEPGCHRVADRGRHADVPGRSSIAGTSSRSTSRFSTSSAPGFVAQAAYVGTRAIRQTANVNINAAGPGGGNAAARSARSSGASPTSTC